MRGLKEHFLEEARKTEFDIASGDFRDLEVRQGSRSDFFYFYDKKARRLITSFLLRDGPQVDTVCDVILIKKDAGYTPRLTLWKRDKTQLKPLDLTEEELVAEGRKILIKSRVDASDCHENLWKLIHFLQEYRDVILPADDFRVMPAEDAELLLQAMEGHDKTAVLTTVKSYLGGELTEQDVELLLDRRKSLQVFDRMLSDTDFFDAERERHAVTPEGLWQLFFETNAWIFGYGLTLLACEKYDDDKLERITTGRDLFTGGGKRSDASMKTKGFLQTLLFAEIKRHDTELLMATPYRTPDVYQVSREVSGAVSQVQKTAHKAVKKLGDLHRQSDPSGRYQFDVSTIRPRQVVVVGQLTQLADGNAINVEKMSSFELWRTGQLGTEILTFDELYERAKYIVETQEGGPTPTGS